MQGFWERILLKDFGIYHGAGESECKVTPLASKQNALSYILTSNWVLCAPNAGRSLLFRGFRTFLSDADKWVTIVLLQCFFIDKLIASENRWISSYFDSRYHTITCYTLLNNIVKWGCNLDRLSGARYCISRPAIGCLSYTHILSRKKITKKSKTLSPRSSKSRHMCPQ